MNTPEIVIIAAIDSKRGIGKQGKIPWRIKEDLKHFKDATIGNPVIMGRVTWESIPEQYQPLSERTNIVVTKSEDFKASGIEIAHSIEDAINIASKLDPKRIFIMGGAQIYTQALSLADRLDLTLILGDFDCDAFFPEYEDIFTKVAAQLRGESKEYSYKFVQLVR